MTIEPNPTPARNKVMKHMPKPAKLAIAIALPLVLIGAIALPFTASAKTPEPPFTSVFKQDQFEIRDYGAQVIAEVTVVSNKNEPANDGFRPLAGYIFGGNAPREKIAMTAPVTRQQGAQIAMTAPVTRQAAGAGDTWNIRFIMPEGSRLETMPRPNNPNVRLSEVPGKRYAVIRFSGFGWQSDLDRKTADLRTFMAGRGLTAIGAPVIAFYDPPLTPPFMRRNEIWLEVSKP
jgi:SOUL heme-binding protein